MVMAKMKTQNANLKLNEDVEVEELLRGEASVMMEVMNQEDTFEAVV